MAIWRFTNTVIIKLLLCVYPQIYIDGVVGSDYLGDIALDDFKVTDTACARE